MAADRRWRAVCAPVSPRRPAQPTVRTADYLFECFGGSAWSARDAVAVGVTIGRVRAAVASGQVRVLRRGTYAVARADAAVAGRDEHLARLRVLQEGTDGAVVSHRSGLVVHRQPDPWSSSIGAVPDIAELTLRGSTGWRSTGLRVHGCPLPDEHVIVVDGLRVTDPLRTAADLARRSRSFPRALWLADAAVRHVVLGTAELDDGPRRAVHDPDLRAPVHRQFADVIESMWGWPGVRIARSAAEHAHPGAETPLESLSRGHVIEHGLPVPEVNVPVLGDDGRTYWADLLWRQFRVIGEADGRLKYAAPDALYAEKLREDALRRAGRIVVRWTWDEIIRTPERVVARIAAALMAQGWRPGSA